jgi:mRNA interferase RelE/StbE
MNVEFDKSFEKSIDRLRDKSLIPKIQRTIRLLESKKNLSEITNSKKLAGYKTYYRIRIGDYRLGFEKISETTIRLIIIAHRKDIYNLFP